MAQINLVRTGTPYANDGASFTLSSEYLSDYPNPASAATGPFNAAVDSFARTVGPMLPWGIRVNVVVRLRLYPLMRRVVEWSQQPRRQRGTLKVSKGQ